MGTTMKSTSFSIILSLLLAISSSSGFVGNNNPPIRVTSRQFEGEEEDTTITTSNKPTSRPDFEFSFEVPKKGIGEYQSLDILLLIYFVLCTFIFL